MSTLNGTPTLPADYAILVNMNTSVVIPVASVLLTAYVVLLITHVLIFLLQKGRGYFFTPSIAMAVSCGGFIVTYTLVLVFETCNVSLNTIIASVPFFLTADLLIFLINVNLSWRLFSSLNPRMGSSLVGRVSIYSTYSLMTVTTLIFCIASIFTFFTTNDSTLDNILMVQEVVALLFLFYSLIPLMYIGAGFFKRSDDPSPLGIPERNSLRYERLLKRKYFVVGFCAVLNLIEAVATAITMHLWRENINGDIVHGAFMYILVPLLHICALTLFACARVDKLFYVFVKNV